ncbi:hypothetical protein [Pinibacter aurantiacus]|nr:hypothetical protein [Pinibacter aurantiacus]
MQYHLLASDYDGTMAHDEEVSDEIVAVLQRLKQTERVLVW